MHPNRKIHNIIPLRVEFFFVCKLQICISGGKEGYAVAGPPDGGTWRGNGSAAAPGNGDMWTGNGSAVAGNVDEVEPFDHHSGLNPFSIGNRLE
jgi:hypothetical protein